jgi:hypothetical protein
VRQLTFIDGDEADIVPRPDPDDDRPEPPWKTHPGHELEWPDNAGTPAREAYIRHLESQASRPWPWPVASVECQLPAIVCRYFPGLASELARVVRSYGDFLRASDWMYQGGDCDPLDAVRDQVIRGLAAIGVKVRKSALETPPELIVPESELIDPATLIEGGARS